MRQVSHGLRRHTRGVLYLGILVGLTVPFYFAFLADTTPFAWDFRAYHHAAELALSGRSFVGAWASVGHGRWVYPPVVVAPFVPLGALPLWPAFVLSTGVQVAAALVLGVVTVQAIERSVGRLPRFDRVLVVTFLLASTYSAVVFGQGQIDPVVVLALALAVGWVHAGRPVAAGVAAGLAAVVKLFPVVIGLYFLRLQAYRAVAAAVLTGVATTLVGVLTFGADAHVRYLEFVLHERSRLDLFVGGANPDVSALSLARPIGALAPGLDPAFYPLVAAVALAPLLVATYADVATTADRAAALLATFGVVLLVSPGSNAHHVFYLYPPLLVLLFTADGFTHQILVAGTAILLCPLQPTVLTDALAAGGVNPAVRTAVTDPLADVLAATSVPLWGVLLTLLGSASHATSDRSKSTPTAAPGD